MKQFLHEREVDTLKKINSEVHPATANGNVALISNSNSTSYTHAGVMQLTDFTLQLLTLTSKTR